MKKKETTKYDNAYIEKLLKDTDNIIREIENKILADKTPKEQQKLRKEWEAEKTKTKKNAQKNAEESQKIIDDITCHFQKLISDNEIGNYFENQNKKLDEEWNELCNNFIKSLDIPPEVFELINNSQLPYQLLASFDSFDKDELNKYDLANNNSNTNDFIAADITIYNLKDTEIPSLIFMKDPNDNLKNKLIGLRLLDSKYNVFGIKVGNTEIINMNERNLTDIQKCLNDNGYEQLETTYTCLYKNGSVRLAFEFDNQITKKSDNSDIEEVSMTIKSINIMIEQI